jgi:hypothetical protein
MEAPTHLSERSRELWHQLTTDFSLETTEVEMVRLALEALDRCEEARLILARDGLTSRGRYGQVARASGGRDRARLAGCCSAT